MNINYQISLFRILPLLYHKFRMGQDNRVEVTDHTRLWAKDEQREVDRLLRYYTALLKSYTRKDRYYQGVFEALSAIVIVLTIIEFNFPTKTLIQLSQIVSIVLLVVSAFVGKMVQYSQKVKALIDCVAGCLVLENEWKDLIGQIDSWAIGDEEARGKISELQRLKLVTVDNPAARVTIPINRKLNEFHTRESIKVMNEREEYFDQATKNR